MSFQKMHSIGLHGLEIVARHGYYPEEQLIGGKFKVDLTVQYNFAQAGQSDDLTETLNYEQLYQLVKEEMQIPSKLLEHVAQRIVDRVAELSVKIERISFQLQKLNPPFPAKLAATSVHIIYSKPNYDYL